MSFSDDLKKEGQLIMKGFENNIRETAIALFSNIIYSTPVDTGLTRANWFCSGAQPSNQETNTADASGAATVSAMVQVVVNLPTWSHFTLTNNKPQAHVLEYGGYPNPVKRGSRVKSAAGSISYQKLSANGYSKQAPNGMVRVSIVDMENRLRALR